MNETPVNEGRLRVVAYYLPQFHRVPENDAWWGPGFTEWTNALGARPLFPGHYQPHQPGELGTYDLLRAESRAAQASLASEHGIDAFLYWHYWFGGRTVLEQPLERVLREGEPPLGFCVGWANQSWTGTWHGAKGRMLIEQTYPGAEDDRRHFEYLLPFFTDSRYLRVDDRPLFYVFRPEQLPDPRVFVDRWRRMAERAGLPGLYLVAEYSDLHGLGTSYDRPEVAGFDAGVHVRLPFHGTRLARARMRLLRKLGLPEIYRYAARPVERPAPGAAPLFPAVFPNWDNTPRAHRAGLVLMGSTPERFRAHFRDALEQVQSLPANERLVFVKSWNEWAEGNHLEPDRRHGRAYLRVIAEERASVRQPR